MLTYPTINPVALTLGPLKIHWYGLMYLLGFVSAWLLAQYRVQKLQLNWTTDQITDFIFYAAMGVIIGGRIGYVLFYDFHNFVHDPLLLIKLWQGGMSFHGGLIGVLLALLLYGYRNQRSFFELTDFIAPMVPIGLAAGRIGNFINGELWGRPTDVAWGMVFPHVDNLPRHPSQLYEFALEGIVLFLILWFYSAKPRPRMAVSGMFLLFYGLFRFILEFFRQPDAQVGFIAFDWLTMGQLLCLPMVVIGVVLLFLSYRKDGLP